MALGNDNLVLKADGNAWSWGDNSTITVVGELGDNSISDRSSPVSVVGGHVFYKVASGTRHSMGLKSNATCWAWGYNSAGQLGDGTSTNRSSPVSVVGNHSFINIKASGAGSSFGLKSNGTCWGWGFNSISDGCPLGDETTTNRNSPVSVHGNHLFTTIATGYASSLALKSDGTCWSWGLGASGQLGDNSLASKSSPVSVVGAHSFIAVSCGFNHSLALKFDGTCWGWGNNSGGSAGGGFLGDNSIITKSSPVSVVGNHSFIALTAGSWYSAGLKANGNIWTWGVGDSGELGLGNAVIDADFGGKSSPVSVVGDHSFVALSGGYSHLLGVKSNGEIWSWGNGLYGQLGDNLTAMQDSPVPVVGSHSFSIISGGGRVALALKANDGSAWAWGTGAGAKGDNTTICKSSPVSVVGAHSFSDIISKGGISWGFSAALKANDGSCWTWGYAGYGSLGNNTTTPNKSSPVSVVGAHSFTAISRGLNSADLKNAMLALKSDGTVWTWGDNSVGQLGINTVIGKSSPVSVVGDHSFTAIANGGQDYNAGQYCMALKADGTLWSWGNNGYGQLGDNATLTAKSSPIPVVGAHSFTSISCGDRFALALKAEDGSCWGWGYNGAGQLGNNGTASRSSPVSVVGAHSFTSVSAGNYTSYGLKGNDGSLWAWGDNSYGQLGNLYASTGANKSSPISVLGAHSFTSISAGYYASYALKADGSMWSWGTNVYGQGGINNLDIRVSPVLVVGGHIFRTTYDDNRQRISTRYNAYINGTFGIQSID